MNETIHSGKTSYQVTAIEVAVSHEIMSVFDH
jgi:hypothetical protein